ncbi:hypothetical protein D9615_001091 [Tricholomella constricta]|uniref:C2H2-type domain-containing protein n=1 Tax=Tricholomella constricta TaxID=117010 RepID=A0A8H5HKK4_9AGAR|nr:hypothetical protein D9615_001091 [Tricholomella constricta]
MVRTSANEPSDDKKETTKKRTNSRKKTVATGIWPCKINGCNKQFAREADLKRHQRTTKLHSMPGFTCPQCDATFTRTDALRRHQKSRHNGVVIEPVEQDPNNEADDDGSSGSQSKSRSATPSSKGKERAPPPQVSNAQYPVQTNRPGPSSYYRQHTLTSTGPYVSRPPIMDPHYAQIGLPTSATRLNAATHWGYPHPWPDGTPQQMSYQQMYYAPHYRPNGVTPPSVHQSPPTAALQQATQNGSATVAQRTSPQTSCPPHNMPRDIKPPVDNTCVSTPTTADSSIAALDPSLNPSESTTLTEEQVLEITQAAMKAVLEAEAERSNAQSRADTASSPSYSEPDRSSTNASHENNDTARNLPIKDKSHAMHGYGLSLERPEPMEHMLTEDGEPMLNPAELLTQESLASPPPS